MQCNFLSHKQSVFEKSFNVKFTLSVLSMFWINKLMIILSNEQTSKLCFYYIQTYWVKFHKLPISTFTNLPPIEIDSLQIQMTTEVPPL